MPRVKKGGSDKQVEASGKKMSSVFVSGFGCCFFFFSEVKRNLDPSQKCWDGEKV